MLLQPDQVFASVGGITFGAVDAFGVDWSLVSVDGWSASKPTVALTQRARQSGAWASASFSGPRTVALTGMVFAPDAAGLRDALDRLAAAVSVRPTLLAVTEAGFTRSVMVQRSDDIIVDWLMPTMASWSIQVVAADWRKFGETLSASTRLPSTSGGVTFPLTFPITFTASVVSGQVNLVNPGNENGPVSIRIDGPCVGPQIAHVSSGSVLTFSSSLALSAGEFLTVDMEAQTVLANGQASRAKFITQRGFSGFDPGSNTWAFTALNYSADALMSVSATPAWL